jgi:pyridoxamine 5'-phosphate oxidase family protein
MSFNQEEVVYLQGQRLARIATVAPDGQPDVMPVGYQFDGKHIYVGGMNPANTRKFRNVRSGNSRVAVVIDDLVAVSPWTVRGMRIYGNAEIVDRQEGQFGPGHYMRITPTASCSWNLDGRPTRHDRPVIYRRAVHEAAVTQSA